jgi:hypothetical protein
VDSPETFETWAIIELMGHRRLAGRVTEQQIAGEGFLRLDVPDGDGPGTTHYYRPGVVYGIHPTSEATARRIADLGRPTPVQRWELPEATPSPGPPPGDPEEPW